MNNSEVAQLVEHVRANLAKRFPKADPDDLLSDAGLAVTLALKAEPADWAHFYRLAFSNAVDIYRERRPEQNRKRNNGSPRVRDMPIAVFPLSEPEHDVAQPEHEEPELLALVNLVPMRLQRDILLCRANGMSLQAIGGMFRLSASRVHYYEQRAIRTIRRKLGLES